MAETKEYKNYINGEWRDSKDGKTFEDRNPANWDDVVGIFPLSTKEDVEDAVRAAKETYLKWKKVPVPKRAEILRRAAEILLERKEEISRWMTREMGKVLKEARGDVQEAIDTGFYAFGEGRRLFSQNTPSELPNKFALTFRQPMGVWAIITPWNFPSALPSWKIFPAILAGNTVVFKPPSDAPAVAYEFVRALVDAGLPPGVLNLVYGSGSVVGEALITHPDIVGISFTGSSETGMRIAEVAGKQLKKISLELGGKNPQIVMWSADIDLAVDGAIWGAYGTTGQRCTATSRLILHEKIYDEFMHKFIERAKQLKIGYGLDESVEVGPVINESQLKKIMKYVEIGQKEGAHLELGGHRLTEGDYAKGWFFEPTVFTGVTPDMTIAQDEIFGPVLSVFKVSSFEEAIAVANNTRYGLSSSIYTRDVVEAMRAIEELEAGITYINAPTIGAETHLPFGGVKHTGNGHREGGWTAYEIFTEWKTVYIDFSGKLQKAQIDTWEE